MDATRLVFNGLAVDGSFQIGLSEYLNSPATVDTARRDGNVWTGFQTDRKGSGEREMVEQLSERFFIWTGIEPQRRVLEGLLDANR
jgi:hypothetical protein